MTLYTEQIQVWTVFGQDFGKSRFGKDQEYSIVNMVKFVSSFTAAHLNTGHIPIVGGHICIVTPLAKVLVSGY